MMTDPIADMLTRIRNAQLVKKHTVDVPFSKLKMRILEIFQKEGYIKGVEKVDLKPAVLRVNLIYSGKKPAISSIKRESRPGHRAYKKATEMPRVLNDYGVAIVSTSKGIMTNKEAREQGVGGEVICSVY